MTGITGDKVNVKALRALYTDNAAARRILDSVASRERNVWVSKVETVSSRLAAEGAPLSRGEIIEALKGFEEVGCGKFYNGRRGQPSRFVWGVGSHSVGLAAAGEKVTIDTETPKAEEREEEDETLLSLEFPLRRGLSIKLTLPSDLTPGEAARLSKFLESIPQPEPTLK